MEQLNIVELIENNPITKLTDTYNVKLLDKMKSNFTEFEQQLFITSFYCFLNYDKLKDFVIDLDNVWKWLEFSSKQNAIKLLEKNFKIGEDYNNSALDLQNKRQKSNDGGQNIKKIMLNIRCFKSYCLKAGTKKASQIHEYYMKMEEIVQELVDEECVELRLKIAEQEKQIASHKNELENADNDKCLLRETTLLSQFPDNIQCIYFGTIDNMNSKKEPLVKFGCSNFFTDRVKCHKTTYNNFRLVGAYRVNNKTQVENAMKIHPVLIKQLQKLKIKKIEHKEILSLKNISLVKIDEIIKDIIKNIEYTPENYTKILEDNDSLKRTIELMNVYTPENYSKMIAENDKLKKDILILEEKIEDDNNTKFNVFNKLVQEKNVLFNKLIETQPSPEDKNFVAKKMKRGIRQSDGLYYFDEGVFPQLEGTRQEVWDGVAYKTAGELIKKDLIIGAEGKVVSKVKAVNATANNRLVTYMKKIGKIGVVTPAVPPEH